VQGTGVVGEGSVDQEGEREREIEKAAHSGASRLYTGSGCGAVPLHQRPLLVPPRRWAFRGERGRGCYPHPQDGATALFKAAQKGYLEVVRLLLERGARVDAATQVRGRSERLRRAGGLDLVGSLWTSPSRNLGRGAGRARRREGEGEGGSRVFWG
jgi:hypothetical protein